VHRGLYGPDGYRSRTASTKFGANCGQEPAGGSRAAAARAFDTGVDAKKRYRLVGPDGQEILSLRPGTLGGHRRTRVYGRLDCPVALSLIARGFDVGRHRVFFADEETAIAAGYRPCGACLREEYRRWKAALA
jgi:hypothetical protein